MSITTPADEAVQAFLKYAKKVSVRAHDRHEADGDVVHVDAYVREDDDVKIENKVDEIKSDIEEETPPPEVSAEPETARSRDLALWKAWKAGGQKPEDLAPLLRNLGGLINSRMSTYIGKVKMVPDSAIRAEFKIQAVNALKSYDPSKGVSIATYVYRYIEKAKRFVTDNQNIGRIPENRIYKIKQFQVTKNNLKERLDRDPTTAELAHDMGWSLAETKRMESEIRSDLVTDGFEEDPTVVAPSKTEEVLKLIRYDLTPAELAVYDKILLGNKSTGDIAKELGEPDYKVSRLKSAIMMRIERRLKEIETI